MHDAKGRELKAGDTVVVPFKVKTVIASEDYCNLELESVASLAPGDSYTSLSAINAKQVLRANPGDDTAFTVVRNGSSTGLR